MRLGAPWGALVVLAASPQADETISMYRTSSQKPGDDLLANFRQQFPQISAGSTAAASASQTATAGNPDAVPGDHDRYVKQSRSVHLYLFFLSPVAGGLVCFAISVQWFQFPNQVEDRPSGERPGLGRRGFPNSPESQLPSRWPGMLDPRDPGGCCILPQAADGGTTGRGVPTSAPGSKMWLCS